MDPRASIAVIGIACRFAGDVNSPQELWRLCAEGRTAWSEIPSSGFDSNGFYHTNSHQNGTHNVRGGHFLSQDLGSFDTGFFGVPLEMVACMDPQFCLQLESAFEAFESAGLTLEQVAGSKTGVFAGSFSRDYAESHMRDPDTLRRFALLGVGGAMASNHISHFFDLRGPSMTIDTGCSTTLTAFHQACQSLKLGESNMAIVGSCAFDSRASGYGRGEGSATVILKRLDDAIRDGDDIRAVVRQTTVNQNGKTETITAPSERAQEELMRTCYSEARLDPAETTYFEAHGTGTRICDPIEARAIASVFCESRPDGRPLLIGSVKANIGHTASGLASIIKVVLALENNQIAPSVNFKTPNNSIDLQALRLQVETQLRPWPELYGTRRASVNSFGYGGANAHVIIEGYAPMRPQAIANEYHPTIDNNGRSRIFVLSAKEETALKKMVENLRCYLNLVKGKRIGKKGKGHLLDRLAFTLGQHRTRFPCVSSLTAESLSMLVDNLEVDELKLNRTNGSPRLGFVFTGPFSHLSAMGRELIEAYPVFRSSLEESGRMLMEFGATWLLLDELMRDNKTSRVNERHLSTPACVGLQIALVELIKTWGIHCSAVTSHSSGEIAAAFTVGALTKKSALGIAYARGQLSPSHNGSMTMVRLGVGKCLGYIARVPSADLVVACMNSPTNTTVSGNIHDLDELERLLRADNISARRLRVDIAYHSSHMESLAEQYESWIRSHVKPCSRDTGKDSEDHRLDIAYSSPTLGRRMTSASEICSPAHWAKSVVDPVRFDEAFHNMCFPHPFAQSGDVEVDMLIEIGPHGALGGPIKEMLSLPKFSRYNIAYRTCLFGMTDAIVMMHELVCELIQKGYAVDLDSVNFPSGRHDIPILHDLPCYPWNHQSRHWSESRHNNALRRRHEIPHDLLGSSVPGMNDSNPVWKNIITDLNLPWIRDHVVQSNIVYPVAAFISMAIEAAQKSNDAKSRKISGYKLRDIKVLQALVMPEDTCNAEIQLELRSGDDNTICAEVWKEFTIHTVSSENKWMKHCKGLIAVKFSDEGSAWSKNDHPLGLGQPHPVQHYRKLSPQQFYSNLHSIGIDYGPSFRNMKSIQAHTDQSRTAFSIANTAASMPRGIQSQSVIHPTTLDSIFQTSYAALPETVFKGGVTLVPTSIKHLWISHDIQRNADSVLIAYGSATRKSNRSVETSISVYDNVANKTALEPVIEVEDLVLQSLGNTYQGNPGSYEKDTFSMALWVPEFTFVSPDMLRKQLSYSIPPREEEIIKDLRRVCFYFVQNALADLTVADISNYDWQFYGFYTWMNALVKLAESNRLAPQSSEWVYDKWADREALMAKSKMASVNGQMVWWLGSNLLHILRGNVTPLDLMRLNNLLPRYYMHGLRWGRSHRQMGELMKRFAHNHRRAKILEIGGGTGATTLINLTALGTDESERGPFAASYDFTDISTEFFEAARERFKKWKNLVQYKQLDIENDPGEQGFELGTYDLVVASQVLHATTYMKNTMSNVRRLLKPSGKLFIIETTQDQIDLQFAFGLLPGWWLSEDEERRSSPSLSVNMWDNVLRDCQFNGVELEIHDCQNEELYSFSIISSTAIDEASAAEVVIITKNEESSPPAVWLDTLRARIASITGSLPLVENLQSVKALDKVCIYVGDLDNPVLRSPDIAEFEAIKLMCIQSKSVLWLTRGGALRCEIVFSALAVGFLRSIRQEYLAKRLITLDLDPLRKTWSTESISHIASVFEKSIMSSADWSHEDFEFAERNGCIQVQRYFPDVVRSQLVVNENAEKLSPDKEHFIQSQRPLRLYIDRPGLLDTLAFRDKLEAHIDLPADSLEIEPQAFGVNYRDVMVAMGQLKNEETMGFECAGIVTQAGESAAAEGFKPGDRVMSLLRGNYARLVRAPWTNAVHIPEDMTFETAASIPTAFTTAYMSLFEFARLREDERVLIHSATGGVGQAAIILAKYARAEIFATVGTLEKGEFLVEKFDIPPDHIFSSRDSSFSRGIISITRGEGVDVVLNSLAGSLMQESFNCLARFGRFVELGKKDVNDNRGLEMGTFGRGTSFSHIDVLQLQDDKDLEIQRIMKKIIRLFSRGCIQAIDPLTICPISELEKAFRLMQASLHIGKIVITVKPDANDLVPVHPPVPFATFRKDASYLVVGGVVGIRRSICQWMIERGAKNLILLSRSAAQPRVVEDFVEEMIEMGCKVKVAKCDIFREDDLALALKSFGESMPPIRGIIQAATVPQNSVLEKMTTEDYDAATKPKVDGSWNLHQAFRNVELDFFIMLSSLTGIFGHPTQSNYSAAGSFQDALAAYRYSYGLPATSIDLGFVSSMEHVSIRDETTERMNKLGYITLTEHDVIRSIEYAILTPFYKQMLLGINTGTGPHWHETSMMGRDLRFDTLRDPPTITGGAPSPSSQPPGLGAQISKASTIEEVASIVIKAISAKITDILWLDGDVDVQKNLAHYAVDSLVAVELRNMLAIRAGAEVSIFDILQSPISSLGLLVANKSKYVDSTLVSV